MSTSETQGPGGTTIAASVLVFLQTAFWLVFGVFALIAAIFLGNVEDIDLELLSAGATAIRSILAVLGVLILSICAVTIVVGIGLLRRRVWARWTAVVLFSVFGVLVVVGLVAAASPEVRGAGGSPLLSLLFLTLDIAIVILLAVPSTFSDFRSVAPPHPPLSPPPPAAPSA